MTNAALRGKPDAGNPHVRFDEGEVAPAATPRRGSLLYNKPAMLALLLTPAALFADPQVERVIVRQQWPWSTDVKVEYSLSGVDASHPVNISVRAFNGDTELDSAALASAITGRLNLITSPVGSFMIDPVAAFGTSEVALGNFRVRLLLSDAMEDVLYKIVDLDPPYTITNVKRKDFYFYTNAVGFVEINYDEDKAGVLGIFEH